MQNRYTGDVGDFGKLALLRALSPARRLGVAWYLCDGEGETSNDGKHTGYLAKPKRFRHLDPELFDCLDALVRAFRAGRPREVSALEHGDLLGGAVFHREIVPRARDERAVWFAGLVAKVDHCDLVFVDPDNGLEGASLSPKSVAWEELRALRRKGRTLIVYHHQTRYRGGAVKEAVYREEQLRDLAGARRVEAIRLRPGTPRFYFLIDADNGLSEGLRAFAQTWQHEAEHFPARGR